MRFYGSKKAVAQFARDQLRSLSPDWRSITITNLGRSGVFCVSIATGSLSDATVKAMARSFYEAVMNILPKNTQGG